MGNKIVRNLLISLCVVIVLALSWYVFFGPEQYYIFDPNIDTEMAPD